MYVHFHQRLRGLIFYAPLQVILGCLITSYMAVVFLLVYCCFFYRPEFNPFKPEALLERPNPLDQAVTYYLRNNWLSSYLKPKLPSINLNLEPTLNKATSHPELSPVIDTIANCIYQCALMFADVHSLSGIAILVSGFATLKNGATTQYHWHILVYMAWFASIAHPTVLTFLRSHLYFHRSERLWRVLTMLLMLGLLCVALGMTGHSGWAAQITDGGNCPSDLAICCFRWEMETDTSVFQFMIISMLLLIHGYPIRLAKTWFTHRMRRLASGLKEKSISMERGWELEHPLNCWH